MLMMKATRILIVGTAVLFGSPHQVGAFTGVQVLHRKPIALDFYQHSYPNLQRFQRSSRIAPPQLSSFEEDQPDKRVSF